MNVTRAQPIGIDLNFRSHTRLVQERLQHIADPARLARGDVYNAAWCQLLGVGNARRIGSAHVACVKKVPVMIKRTDLNNRLLQSGCYAGDLSGEGRDNEVVGLAWTGVI